MSENSIQVLKNNYKILLRVTRTDYRSFYAGSILGIGWMVLVPLLLLAVYAVVYLFIFRVRPANMQPVLYVLYIFAGLVPFLMSAEVLGRVPSSIVKNESMLTNTVFPIDLLPVKDVLLTQGSMISGMAVIFGLTLIVQGISLYTFVSILLVIIIWILHLMFMIGLAWILSIANIIFRDLEHLMRIIVIILMVSLPIAYTPDMIPGALRFFFYLNPFAYFIVPYQKIIVLRTMPSFIEIFVLIGLSLLSFWGGGMIFSKIKGVIVDYV